MQDCTVGRTIWSQISANVKRELAAREAVASAEGLHFRVTLAGKHGGRSNKLYKICVTYDTGADLYHVRLVEIARKTLEVSDLNLCTHVPVEALDAAILGVCRVRW